MGSLGNKQRGESFRIVLDIDSAPIGTPTITITRDQGTALDTPINGEDMSIGASNLKWYYDYTTEAGAQTGAYLAEMYAVSGSDTLGGTDNWKVTVNDADDIKAETALIKIETDKIQGIDTNLDTVKDTDLPAVKAETALIVEDTGTTMPATLTGIEDKIDTVDTVVDSIQVDTTAIEAKVDGVITDIAEVPTVGEIDTELSDNHGYGPWGGAAGTGDYATVINMKADSVAVQGVKVSIHNAANDDAPAFGPHTTDLNGDTVAFNLDNGVYYVRASKAGYTYTNSTITVDNASETFDKTMTANVITPPADVDLCKLHLTPILLDGSDVTDLVINIRSDGRLTKIDGNFVENAEMEFILDDTTGPDSYYFEAAIGAVVKITCPRLGFNHGDITIPDLGTKDVYLLINE